MPERTDQPTPQPTPVADDAHASVTQLHQRAAADLAAAKAAARAKQEQGDTGHRLGILPGDGH